ncbi:MAG: hypothetical protein WC264_02385 [Candidatus Paceibacterota bacterium]|jgi:hypothetical protein
MKKKNFYIISFFAILIIITGFLFLQTKADAQSTSVPVSGTAVITNMGYSISFSGNNGGTLGNIPYNVQYDISNNSFSGYAWSPEYGWVNFTGLSASIPSFSNDTETPTNWATGAISLKGTNGGSSANIPYSVAFNLDGTANSVNHWAWGGNVIGWIDFSGVVITTNIINGTCSYTHYICASGTNSNFVDGTSTWTWDCLGANGGTNQTGCSQDKNICTPPQVLNSNNECVDPTYSSCNNNLELDNGETGIDCGGLDCPSCKKPPKYIEN